MKGQIITVALILLGHTFLTPAVQAIGFDYYNDHGVMSYGKGYWGDKKSGHIFHSGHTHSRIHIHSGWISDSRHH